MLSPKLNIEGVHNTLVNGIRNFVDKIGAKGVVLGLSGGIDSAVVAALAVEALGSNRVYGFMMPSEFSTSHSIKDAVDLAENLKMGYKIIPIAKIFNDYTEALADVFGPDNKWNVAEENLQARIRGTLLMAYSNKFGYLLLNTSNKSELSTGYGTLYGDLAGAAMVIADLYKCEVYELAHYLNRNGVVIPENTITKAPSAELREGQKDSDSLPDYSILDPLLYALNEGGQTPEQLIAAGYNKADVERMVSLRRGAAFKVAQIPPIFNVSEKPLVYKEKCLL